MMFTLTCPAFSHGISVHVSLNILNMPACLFFSMSRPHVYRVSYIGLCALLLTLSPSVLSPIALFPRVLESSRLIFQLLLFWFRQSLTLLLSVPHIHDLTISHPPLSLILSPYCLLLTLALVGSTSTLVRFPSCPFIHLMLESLFPVLILTYLLDSSYFRPFPFSSFAISTCFVPILGITVRPSFTPSCLVSFVTEPHLSLPVRISEESNPFMEDMMGAL